MKDLLERAMMLSLEFLEKKCWASYVGHTVKDTPGGVIIRLRGKDLNSKSIRVLTFVSREGIITQPKRIGRNASRGTGKVIKEFACQMTH